MPNRSSSEYTCSKMSSRRMIRPVYNIDEDEDEQRRDASGRKRVDVIDCLLESSSSDEDEYDFRRTSRLPSKADQIVWLTFTEISHIRSVLSRSSSQRPEEKSSSWKFFQDQFCFCCGKQLNSSLFVPIFLSSSLCFICQQRICQTCSVDNYLPPPSEQLFPFYLPHLLRFQAIKPSQSTRANNQSNSKGKTLCYVCEQVKVDRSISVINVFAFDRSWLRVCFSLNIVRFSLLIHFIGVHVVNFLHYRRIVNVHRSSQDYRRKFPM